MLWEKMNAKQVLSCYNPMKTSVMLRRVLSLSVLLPVLANAQGPAPAPNASHPVAIAPGKPGDVDSYEIVVENGQLFRPTGQGQRFAAPTLAEVVKRLRELHPDANIVLAPELADLPVGDIKMHATEMAEELEAVRVASGATFTWRTSGSGTSLFVLEPTAKSAKRPESDVQVEVFNLTGYLARLRKSYPDMKDPAAISEFGKMEAQEAQAVVDQTLQDAGVGRLKFEFHSGANLLIVMGRPDSLSIARTVLNGLIMSPPGENQELDMLNGLMKISQTRGRDAQSETDLGSRLGDLNSRLNELQAENEHLKATLKQLKDQIAKPTP